MPGESFRFIHASDFHLETPLGDLDQLPSHLSDVLAGAARSAAAAVFEAAVAENIDFLILSGDLLHPVAAGPHGMSLLLDGFERLHAADTPVFWAAGVADDPKQWPEAVPLPPNVTLFPKDRAVTVPYQRSGRTICHVVGRSSEGRSTLHVPGFQTETTDEFTIGVGHGIADAASLSAARMDFWALGGPHQYTEIEGGAPAGAVAPGTPQGKCFNESGSHGYCVVDVDAERTARIHRIPCDRVRYSDQNVDVNDIRAVGSLRNYLGQTIGTLANEAEGRHLLIRWSVNLTDAESLTLIGDASDLLRQIRRDHGQSNPAAWSTQLIVRPPKRFPKSWLDEDTILGDFLRASQRIRGGQAAPKSRGGRDEESGEATTGKHAVDLMPFTEEHTGLPATSANLLGDLPASARDEILDDATLLGVELLRGGKPNWGRKV